MSKPSVSLCMIVKNEEDYLPGCLNSVQNYVNEIVIVDTGSTDKTKDIIEKYKATLIETTWEGNFSKARNLAIDNASSDWILILDADERLEQVDLHHWTNLLHDSNVDGYNFMVIDYLGEDKKESYLTGTSLRMFRNIPKYRYKRRIHEQIEKSIIDNSKLKTPCIFSNVKIFHYGYLAETIKKKNKAERNITLLQEEVRQTGDYFSYYNLGAEYLRVGKFKKAISCFDECLKCDNYHLLYVAECHKKKALTLFLSQEYHESLNFLELSISKYPKYTDLYFLASEVCYTLGDFDKANQFLKQCLKVGEVVEYKYTSLKGVGTFRARYRLGIVAEAQQNNDLALSYYHDSIKNNPTFIYSIKALINLVNKTVPKKQFLNRFLMYINFMRDVDKYYIAYMACSELGYFKNSIKIFKKAVEEGLVISAKVSLQYALTLLLNENYDEVEKYLLLAKQQNGDITEINRLGLVLSLVDKSQVKAKKYSKSNKLYLQLLKINRSKKKVKQSYKLSEADINECNKILEILIRSKKIELVKHIIESVNQYENLELRTHICNLYIKNKYYKLAIVELKDCINKGLNNFNVNYLLGLAYNKLGILKKSIEYLEISLAQKNSISTVKLLSETYHKISQATILEGLKMYPESQELHNKLSGRRL